MYVCKCVCMYVSVCVCMYVCMFVCMYVYMHVSFIPNELCMGLVMDICMLGWLVEIHILEEA